MLRILGLLYKSKGNRLSKELNMLSLINFLNMAAGGLSGIFLNIFIWKMSNLNVVIEYNIYTFITVPIIFVLGGWMSKRVGLRINLILGMAFSAIFYLTVILFRNSLVQYIPIIGIMKGISLGFYFMAFNVLIYDFSDENNRDYFFGIIGLTNSIGSMIFPFIAGYIIWTIPGMRGYEVIFVLSFLLLLVGTILSFVVPDKSSKAKFKLIQMLKTSAADRDLRNTMLADVLSGGRWVIIAIALNILIYEITKKELTVGNFSFWVYLAATIGSYIGGVLIKPKSRHAYLLFSTVAIAVISAVFLFDISVLTLYIFGITNAIFDSWSLISNTAISYSVISKIPRSSEIRTEVMVIKEFAYVIGRMIVLFAFMAVSARNDLIAILLSVLGAIQVIRWVLLRKVGRIKEETA